MEELGCETSSQAPTPAVLTTVPGPHFQEENHYPRVFVRTAWMVDESTQNTVYNMANVKRAFRCTAF